MVTYARHLISTTNRAFVESWDTDASVLSSRLEFSASNKRDWCHTLGGGKWKKAILSTKENMIRRNGVWNYGGNKRRKAKSTLRFSMRKTTRERVEEMLGGKLKEFVRRVNNFFVWLLYTAHCWMHGSEILKP